MCGRASYDKLVGLASLLGFMAVGAAGGIIVADSFKAVFVTMDRRKMLREEKKRKATELRDGGVKVWKNW